MKKVTKKIPRSKNTAEKSHTYAIGFYDAFDGWMGSINHGKQIKSLSKAKSECDKYMKDLGDDNKRMGEHYGVFDENGKEIYRGY